jgi:hypothetical protein
MRTIEKKYEARISKNEGENSKNQIPNSKEENPAFPDIEHLTSSLGHKI